MKRLHRIAIISLLFFLYSFGLTAAAQENALRVTVVSDKKTYASDHTAKVTIKVENTSGDVLKNVRLKHVLPDGLVYAYGSEEGFLFDEIPAYGIVSKTVSVRRGDHAVKISVQADKARYEADETAMLTVKAENLSNRTMRNLSIRHILPDGLIYEGPQKDELSAFAIGAGEKKIFQVKVKKRPPTLHVTLETDRKQYGKDDIAQITITVENTSNKAVRDVNLEHFLPNGLKYVEGKEEDTFRHAIIRAHEKVSHIVQVERVAVESVPATGDQSEDIARVSMLLFTFSAMLLAGIAKNKCRQSED